MSVPIKGQSYYYSAQQQGIDHRSKALVVEKCLPYIQGPHILELGYIDDIWTRHYIEKDFHFDIVEGADKNTERAIRAYRENPKVRIFHSLFESFTADRPYNTIVAGDMLMYIRDDIAFLQKLKTWLYPDGNLVITVPNHHSLHRRIGTYLGKEPTPRTLNAQDNLVGNLRTYDRYDLRHLLLGTGYEIALLKGCFLKPFSSAQMGHLGDDVLRALLDVGDELEDYCWMIIAVCSPGSSPQEVSF